MTRRDFELIADTIRELPTTMRLRVALQFADNLRGTNPRFDRVRFLRACGVEA